MERREPFRTMGGNVNWYSHYGEQHGGSLKNLKQPYDPAMPLPSTYPEKTIIRKETCTPLFTAALFTKAKTWKPHKWQSTEEWMRKIRYIYTHGM